MTVLTENERNWWLERLDAALDGELVAGERERFMELADVDPLLADEWALATAMQEALASEEVPACPARVHAGIEAHVRTFARARRPLRPADRRAPWKNFVVVAVLAILAVVATLQIGSSGPGVPSAPTAAAPNVVVARATQDVQWALAFVSDVGGAAGHSVHLGTSDRAGENP